MRDKLTTLGIKASPDGKYFDGGGLSLVKAGGVGRWVYRYSHLGSRREMGLGSLLDLPLARARKARDEWAAILASGVDPISERNARKDAEKAAAAKSDPTFEEMAHIVFEARKAKLRGDGERGRWFSPLRLYMVPKMGRKRMSAIHQSDIMDALKPIWKNKHPTAKKAIERTMIVFRQARLMGIDCDPFTVEAAGHMLGEVTHKAEPMPSTPWQDIPALYDRLGNSAAGLCLRFMILTAVRSDGCRGAHRDEIDGNVWTVPEDRIKGQEGKVEPFRVPLSQEALRVCHASLSSGHLFTAHEGQPISSTAIAKRLNLLGEAGRPHGFRTSFRTWVQDTDACSFDVAETILGHSVGGKIERTYARSDLLDRRAPVMESWARYVTGAASVVIKLRG